MRGDLALGERATRTSGIEGQWGLVCRSSTGQREAETPFLARAHRLSCALGPRAKQGLGWESGFDVPAVLGGPPGKAGVNVACCGERTLEAKLSGIFLSCGSLEAAILGKSGPAHQR